ncbi:hypothetical protein [Sphingomonas lycopersici]|uniref:Uncharacterized protein n=1 Tax=Sphingomonas lycopersici TaxID=2951807 RepID=A0AA41ZCL5_9SPHN|nr:hypothetical protein [Sphingomonas lycopersici]MCW6536877.1 hypothetical protein [Sphingomonas lycopersici]
MLEGEGRAAATRAPFDALIVATPDFVRDRSLRNVVETTGGRVLASVNWDEAVARVEATVVAPLLLLDAAGRMTSSSRRRSIVSTATPPGEGWRSSRD